jgi:hypothetical protein
MCEIVAHTNPDGSVVLHATSDEFVYEMVVSKNVPPPFFSDESLSVLRGFDGALTSVSVTMAAATDDTEFSTEVRSVMSNGKEDPVDVQDFPYFQFMTAEVWQHLWGKLFAPL